MRVSELMTRDVRIANPNETIQEAARMMAEIDAGAIPVGDNDRLVGMLTDRDIAVRAVAEGRGPDTKVGDVMTNDVKYCFETKTPTMSAAISVTNRFAGFRWSTATSASSVSFRWVTWRWKVGTELPERRWRRFRGPAGSTRKPTTRGISPVRARGGWTRSRRLRVLWFRWANNET